jgi:hypothetical protein
METQRVLAVETNENVIRPCTGSALELEPVGVIPRTGQNKAFHRHAIGVAVKHLTLGGAK